VSALELVQGPLRAGADPLLVATLRPSAGVAVTAACCVALRNTLLRVPSEVASLADLIKQRPAMFPALQRAASVVGGAMRGRTTRAVVDETTEPFPTLLSLG
jgi:hypothetical protein